MTARLPIALGAAFFLAASPLFAHDHGPTPPEMAYNDMIAAFGIDFETAEIKTEKISDGLHVLFGIGGNIAVSSGSDGVLVVDDQFQQLIPKIKAAISDFSDDNIDMAVNTHWHFDHADGNLSLGEEGVQIFAQKNSRTKMLSDNFVNLVAFRFNQKAYPAHALPEVTYDREMAIHYNGEEISLLHFGPAHTTGDSVVYFRGRNAIHMGDVFNNTGYPFIDADNGGDIDGMIAFCEAVIEIINEDTIVIPGHGSVTDYNKLVRYVEVLTATRNNIAALIDEEKSFQEIIAAKPTADFDEEFNANEQSVLSYVDRVYVSLTK